MRIDITDREALASVVSSDLLAFLRVLGWSQAYLDADRMAVFRKEVSGSEAEVLVPLRPQLADYASAIHSVLEALADVEGLSQLQVFNDVQNVNADIVRVQVEHSTFSDGSIPLESGSRLVDRAVDLLVAGACAADHPRAVYASRRSNQVNDYLREARLGQTERGSYIVTMKTIVPPVLIEKTGQHVLPDGEADAPFARRVTRTLAQALDVTRRAITEASASGAFDPFRVAVERGVSANLLESIAGLIADTSASETEVNLTWSRTRPIDTGVPSKAKFSAEDEPILREASNRLRESAPKPEHRIEGFVKILHRESDKAPGTITVRAVIEGKGRTVRIQLSPDDYKRAVEAHGDWKAIEVSGELVRQGKLFELRDPKEFRLYEADVEEEDESAAEENE